MSLISRIFSRRHFAAAACAIVLPVAALIACSEAPKLPKSADDGAATESAPDIASETAPGAGVERKVAEPESAAPAPAGRYYKRARPKEAAPSTTAEEESGYPEAAAPVEPGMADVAPPPSAAEPPPMDVPEMDTMGRGYGGGYSGGAASSTAAPSPPPPAPSMAAPEKPASDFSATGVGPGGGGTGMGGGVGRGFGTIGHGSGASGTAAAPPAAEQPQTFDVVPVYYGTDRGVEPNAKRLQYGTERAHKLQLGRALVTVPTSHKVPNIERPWVVEIPYFKYKIYEEKEDPAKHFTMQEVAALSKEQLLAYIKERLDASKTFQKHAFVFVHGFNTSFDAAVYRTAQIAYDLKFDGAPFVYSWPSGGKIASYTYDRGSAEAAEPHLAAFLDFVVKESGAKSISLIAHSMGNELLLRVLERMRPTVPEGVVISQVILAAPDVDRDKFSNIARQITDFAKGVTLYAAANDRALEYSARFWGGVPRAGDVPASGPLIVEGVDTIDVTAVSTDTLSLNHSSYAEKKELLNDIKRLIQSGERPPDKREPFLKKITTAAGTFWRFPQAIPPEAVPTGTVP